MDLDSANKIKEEIKVFCCPRTERNILSVMVFMSFRCIISKFLGGIKYKIEDVCLLGCCAKQSSGNLLTFQMCFTALMMEAVSASETSVVAQWLTFLVRIRDVSVPILGPGDRLS
jgi:hypothetical protein